MFNKLFTAAAEKYIIQKLLESPTFMSLARKTHGAVSEIQTKGLPHLKQKNIELVENVKRAANEIQEQGLPKLKDVNNIIQQEVQVKSKFINTFVQQMKQNLKLKK